MSNEQGDSWVQVSSRPSTSSLSSDDIITTGLRIQDEPNRRRRFRSVVAAQLEHSSQDECTESESEADHVLTSSDEQPLTARPQDDSDDGRTAVNHPISRSGNTFQPPPNAFRRAGTSSDVRPQRPVRPRTRHSYAGHEAQEVHSPLDVLHHDAALRASLTTLLSCAAAARGLPKRQPLSAGPVMSRQNIIQPSTLRLVPESALRREPVFAPTIGSHATSSGDEARKRSPSRERGPKRKRRSSTAHPGDDLLISPTLFTWVVGAGVVVILSALSFSTGYSVGKEVGKLEAGAVNMPTDCAREVGRSGMGLRRLQLAAA